MNDYQEYRSYGSYLSRVFAIIIAFMLLVFAIWGVVNIANNTDDPKLGDTAPVATAPDSDGAKEAAKNAGLTKPNKNTSTSDDSDITINNINNDSTENNSGEDADDNDSDDNNNDNVSANSNEIVVDQDGVVNTPDLGGGETLATNTDIEADNNAYVAGTTIDKDKDLPSTGAELNIVLLIGAVTFVGTKLLLPKE